MKIDSVGQGHYCGKHLEDLGFPVIYVNVGHSSGEPTRFTNLKAELYWALCENAAKGTSRAV